MASTSLTNTNISDTYVGVLHAKGEPLPATGSEYIYDGFGNRSGLRLGRDEIDISGTLGSDFATAAAKALFPVGSVMFSVDDVNPTQRFAGTTWVRVAEGRFIAGVGTGDDGTDTQAVPAGNDSTGKYKHTLTEAELPSHSHNTFKDISSSANNTTNFAARKDASGGSQNYAIQSTTETPDVFPTSNTGSGTAHNNIPPSFGLYAWHRTA
jgi:hypothetical protein|tara:strand:+ start:14683 stop:15312 length:630 start_codon:yes stop_codon:yes gene_type:complete